jgi:hypothetical protein
MLRSLLPIILVLAMGCGRANRSVVGSASTADRADAVVNPTGSCGTLADPGRIGYGGGGGTWVPDCQNPLRREYWRVGTTDGKSAHTLPRLDGTPQLQPACADANDVLHSLVERYALCAAADSEAKVNLVNNMELADALRLTHFLHGQLKFAVQEAIAHSPNTTTIEPYPLPGDILDGCALHPNSPELQAMCVREQNNLVGGLGLTYMGPGAVELAARLNELYGIAAN